MKHERLVDELRRANPVDESQLDDWAANEGEDFLRSRVLTRMPATTGGEHRARPRFLVAVGGAIALVLAIVVPLLILASAGAPDGQPLKANTSSPASVPQSDHYALRGETLEQLVSLAADLGVYHPAPVPSDVEGGSKLVQEAVGYGILLPSEGPDFRLNDSLSRGEFAVWLWRAFGAHLSVGEPSTIPDLKHLPEQKQRAISSLVQAGILSLDTDGRFHAADPFTPEERSRILGRIADRLSL